MVKTARGMGSIPIQGNKMLSCSMGGPKEAGGGEEKEPVSRYGSNLSVNQQMNR